MLLLQQSFFGYNNDEEDEKVQYICCTGYIIIFERKAIAAHQATQLPSWLQSQDGDNPLRREALMRKWNRFCYHLHLEMFHTPTRQLLLLEKNYLYCMPYGLVNESWREISLIRSLGLRNLVLLCPRSTFSCGCQFVFVWLTFLHTPVFTSPPPSSVSPVPWITVEDDDIFRNAQRVKMKDLAATKQILELISLRARPALPPLCDVLNAMINFYDDVPIGGYISAGSNLHHHQFLESFVKIYLWRTQSTRSTLHGILYCMLAITSQSVCGHRGLVRVLYCFVMRLRMCQWCSFRPIQYYSDYAMKL